MITAGSSMAAMSVNSPPHCGQVVMSMAKTRVSNWAQLIRARGEGARESPSPLAVSVAWSASVPVIDNKDGRLIGIVARRDILRGYVSSEPE